MKLHNSFGPKVSAELHLPGCVASGLHPLGPGLGCERRAGGCTPGPTRSACLQDHGLLGADEGWAVEDLGWTWDVGCKDVEPIDGDSNWHQVRDFTSTMDLGLRKNEAARIMLAKHEIT